MQTLQTLDDHARVPAIGDFRFSTEYRPDPEKPGEFLAEDRVSWIKIGDALNSRTSDKIARLMPNAGRKPPRPAALEWAFIEPAYLKWKAGEEIPVDGTPLAAWPGCDHALAEVLKQRHVVTVEQFAGLADHLLGGLGVPDSRRRQVMARAFLEAQKGASHVEAELAERDDRIAKLTRQIEELDEAMEKLTRPDQAKARSKAA